MNFFWHSRESASCSGQGDLRRREHEQVPYSSTLTKNSTFAPGVVFTIRRLSFGRRMELSRKIREISRRIDFVAAGEELQERIEANLLALEIDATYLDWGLVGVDGLIIDGEAATPALLLDKGPPELTDEIVRTIKTQCGLTEQERKN